MEQNSLFRFIIDNSINMVIVYDNAGRILYANQAAMESFEYHEELVTCSISEIFPNEFTIKDGMVFTECQLDGSYQDVMAYRKNQTCFPMKARFLVHNEVESLFEKTYICTAYDATKEIFMEKQLSNADKEVEAALKVKSEFIANVTHELRTPVNGIQGNIMELQRRVESNEEQKYLDLIERGCRDMHAIINNVLDFSKLEAGKFSLELREFNFRNMIEYVRGNHMPKITEKGLDLSIKVSDEIPEYVMGDELRIVQILNNLISNAYKFTSVGGIHLEVVKTAQEVDRMELFFMVIDSGIGIAKADQDKLFKSFSQVDASISRKYGGTGLGLNICKQLVELMDGNIHVTSAPGKGTTFSFHVWLKMTGDDVEKAQKETTAAAVTSMQVPKPDAQQMLDRIQSMSNAQVNESTWEYGSEENHSELEKNMSKLILSIEMENWEKAEMFMEAIKQLIENAPREVKSAGLRMKMAVQKGDYEKAIAAYEVLNNML